MDKISTYGIKYVITDKAIQTYCFMNEHHVEWVENRKRFT